MEPEQNLNQPLMPPTTSIPQGTAVPPVSVETQQPKKPFLAPVLFFIIIIGVIATIGYFALTKFKNFLPFAPTATVQPTSLPTPSPLPTPTPTATPEAVSDSLEDGVIQKELDQTQVGEESQDLQEIEKDLNQL